MFHTNHTKSDWRNISSKDKGHYSVFGVFGEKENLELAFEKLYNLGFIEKDILVVMPERIDVLEKEAKRNKDIIHHGSILVSIHCIDSDMMNTAKKLLEVSGAQDIASTSEPTSESSGNFA